MEDTHTYTLIEELQGVAKVEREQGHFYTGNMIDRAIQQIRNLEKEKLNIEMYARTLHGRILAMQGGDSIPNISDVG